MLKTTVQLSYACDKKELFYEKKAGQRVRVLGPIVSSMSGEDPQIT